MSVSFVPRDVAELLEKIPNSSPSVAESALIWKFTKLENKLVMSSLTTSFPP